MPATDNKFQLMSTTTCLDRSCEMNCSSTNYDQSKQMFRLKFSGQSVNADWGNKHTYDVRDVSFEHTPTNTGFLWINREVRIAEYI